MNPETSLPLPLYLLSIAVRTLLILVFLIAGIRLFGKRDVGGLNLLDVVLVLLLGNAVQNAMTNGSGQLGVGLVSAGMLIFINRSRGALFARAAWLQKAVIGEPTILVQDGKIDRRAMRVQGVDEEELLAAMRDISLTELRQVRLAVLEKDGNISVIPKNS